MFITYLVLALSVSIDSFGIGITYGIRNTKIFRTAKVILFAISILVTSLSINLGACLSNVFSESFTKWIGSCFLILMGLWIIYQALNTNDCVSGSATYKSLYGFPTKKDEGEETLNNTSSPTIYKFMIRFLGITIQIIRNPISSDLDHSKGIDWKESIYLGICLSIDSLCIGICSSMIGYSSFLFPVLVASFQLVFLSVGRILGNKIFAISNIPENIWSTLSGVLLICIGVSRFFI